MTGLWLSLAQVREIVTHARQDSPAEACGLILGSNHHAETIIPISNIAGNPANQYYMDERSLVSALIRMQHSGQTLLGIYHSHPRGNAIPSPTDIREAHYTDAAYVIVGLRSPEPEIMAWHIQPGHVERVNLHISSGSVPPQMESDEHLSNAQYTAVLLAGIFAALIVIITALVLLPPAPVIDPRLLNQLPR